MSLLADLVEVVLVDGVGDAIAALPPRGRHGVVGLAGVALAAAVGVALIVWPSGEDRPTWTVVLAAVSVVYGLILGLASGLAFANERGDRGFALFALAGCAGAAVLPLVSLAL